MNRMKLRIALVIALVLLTGTMFTSAFLPTTIRNQVQESILLDLNTSLVAYTDHDPIIINSNADFVAQGWPGSGTAEDPFIIEGLSIVESNSRCIEIRNNQSEQGITNHYFVIRNCYLIGGGDEYEGGAMYLHKISVGVIEDNMISNPVDGWGIELYSASTTGIVHNLTIHRNVFFDSYNGRLMNIGGNRNYTITNNIGDGIVRFGFFRNVIVSNNSFTEIYINGAPYRQMTGCQIYNNTAECFYVEDCDFISLNNNTITRLLRIRGCHNATLIGNVILGRSLLGCGNGQLHFPLRDLIAMWNVFNDSIYQEWASPKVENYFDYNWYFDYVGIDEDGDNIGDVPYEQYTAPLGSGYEAVIDLHPLIELKGFVIPEPVITTTTTTTTTTTDETTTTETTTTDDGTTNGEAADGEIPPSLIYAIIGGTCGIIALFVLAVKRVKK